MSGQTQIKFSVLSDFLIKNADKNLFYEFIKSTFDLSDAAFKLYKKFVDQFIKNHSFRWKKKSKFRPKYFQQHFKSWLGNTFELPEVTFEEATRKDFGDCSERTKKRRADQLRQETHQNEIQIAFLSNLSETDEIAAKIVKLVLKADADKKKRILALIENEPKDVLPYSSNESLALLIDGKLTRSQYELIQTQAKQRCANIYPSYAKVLEAKKSCYPADIEITEQGVKIPLQSLTNKTAERLVESCDREKFANMGKSNTLTMITKWGMDGASGQSSYKQIFNDGPGSKSDASVFMVSMVPLQLKSNRDVLWTNPHPSSTKLCRPIQFDFVKENEKLTIDTYQQIQEEIDNLNCTKVDFNGLRMRIKHEFNLTMLDGKSTNYLTATSFSNCNVCDAYPTDMNKPARLESKSPEEENYQFGLSTLHCWIRFLECMLHIAFKEPVKKCRVSDPDEKAIVSANKIRIQELYQTEKGLYLDVVRPGVGNSNDGNTARRFFQDPKFAAETTELDEELIIRFRTILIAISSRKKIDEVKFRKYATDTYDRYIELYSWYHMPPSVHKVLLHGADIIESFDLPIGFYSEEPQEARNKDFRRIRECNTRKMSRVETNEDIIHGLLISSDPVITSFRREYERKPLEFDQGVLDLFVQDCDG